MRQYRFVLLMVVLFAGCGNFEWFPNNSTFQNNSTSTTTPPTPPAATIIKSISFPTGVTWVSDLVYDKNSASFWLLAGTSLAPNSLVKINATTGALEQQFQLSSPVVPLPDTIVDGSSIALDGASSVWITSNGYDNSKTPAAPVSEIYKFWASGVFQATYPCPATNTGFCQGIVWDSTTSSFWVAGSDNKNLVNFKNVSGVLTTDKTYSNLWSTNGVNDIGFDISTNQLVVLKNGMIPVNASSGSLGTKKSFIVPGSGRGDWDGTYFWVIDNSEKKLKAVFVN